MQKTKIEWTDWVWNPIKGLCPQACWYCYGRAMYRRFKWSPNIRFEFEQSLLGQGCAKKGDKVFICSTFELFLPMIHGSYDLVKSWRDRIFDTIRLNPEVTFQILTKLPENIDREMPDNVWLGVSVTSDKDYGRLSELKKHKATIRFVSFEPLLDRLSAPTILNCREFNWAIFGRLTGHGNKYNPKREWIAREVNYLRGVGIPVFLKNNLKEIWGDNLIQEFPK